MTKIAAFCLALCLVSAGLDQRCVSGQIRSGTHLKKDQKNSQDDMKSYPGIQCQLSCNSKMLDPSQDIQFLIKIENQSANSIKFPLGLCHQLKWIAFVDVYFQTDSGKITRFRATPDIDIKSLHHHDPLEIPPHTSIQESFTLRRMHPQEVLLDNFLSTLSKQKKVTVWAALVDITSPLDDKGLGSRFFESNRVEMNLTQSKNK